MSPIEYFAYFTMGGLWVFMIIVLRKLSEREGER